DIGHQQIALHFCRKMSAAERLQARARPRPLLIDLWRLGVLDRVVHVPREQSPVIRYRSRAINHDVLSPLVEDVSVRVGKAERDIGVELLRSWLITIDAGAGITEHRGPGGLDLRLMKRPFLKIKRSARIEREAVGRMVRVGRIET